MASEPVQCPTCPGKMAFGARRCWTCQHSERPSAAYAKRLLGLPSRTSKAASLKVWKAKTVAAHGRNDHEALIKLSAIKQALKRSGACLDCGDPVSSDADRCTFCFRKRRGQRRIGVKLEPHTT